MTTTSVSLCVGCIHLKRAGRPADATIAPEPRTCAAFPSPAQIPAEILDGTVDHRQPYLGDHGLQYVEMIEGVAAAYDAHPRLMRSAPKTL